MSTVETAVDSHDLSSVTEGGSVFDVVEVVTEAELALERPRAEVPEESVHPAHMTSSATTPATRFTVQACLDVSAR